MKISKLRNDKEVRTKKQCLKEKLFFIIGLILIIVFCITATIINIFIPAFSWRWIFFILFALLIVWGFLNAKFQFNAKFGDNKQIKYFNSLIIFAIIHYLILDCLFLSISNEWLIWIYIFGCIALIKIFYNLSVSFLEKHNKTLFTNISLLIDFIIGMCLTVYLIYLIPERFINLQTIVTTVVASVYGGLLTLMGVAWTIKHSEKLKHEEARAKAKPLFTFNYITYEDLKINHKKVCFIMDISTGIESYAEFENSDMSSFTITRFYYEKNWHLAESNNVMLPNNTLLVQLMRNDMIEHVIMEVVDIYKRKYYYDLMFVCMPPMQPVKYCTLGQLQEISTNELKEKQIPIE